MKETCKLCFTSDFVEFDGDIVCKKCGTVAGSAEIQHTITPKYSISISSESKLGSSNIVDSSLKLEHLNKKFTSNILNGHDAYLGYFSQSCEDLHMPKNIARNAFHLFQKLRHVKLGLAKIAIFSIAQAYTISDALYDEDLLIKSVLYRFRLKRDITISKSLYSVKPTAIEMKLINNSLDSELLIFKKNIDPDKYHEAIKIVDLFSGNYNSQTKSTQEFLEAYGMPTTPIIISTRGARKK